MISPDPYVGRVLFPKRPEITDLFLDERLGNNSLIIPAGTLIRRPKRIDSTRELSKIYRALAQGYTVSKDIPAYITLSADLAITPQIGIWLLNGNKRKVHAQRYLVWNDEDQTPLYNRVPIIYDKVKYNTKMSFHELMVRCEAQWVVPDYIKTENNFGLTITDLYDLNTFTKTQPIAFICNHCNSSFVKSISEVRENILDNTSPCLMCTRLVYKSGSSYTERNILLKLMEKGYTVYTGNLATFPTSHPLWKTKVLHIDGIIKLSNGMTVAFDFDGKNWHEDTDRDVRKTRVIIEEKHADYYIRMRDELPSLNMDIAEYIELDCKTRSYNKRNHKIEYNANFYPVAMKKLEKTLERLNNMTDSDDK